MTEAQVAALMSQPGRVSLDEIVIIARHYHARLFNQQADPRHVELSEEVQTRLEQMNYLLKSVAVLLTEYSRRSFGAKIEIDPGGQLYFTMFLYAEAFYYFAHRVQDILEDEGLPHISAFKRSRMITLIRNHLIEHPYGRYKDFGGRHGAMSSMTGPMILVKGKGEAPKKLRPRQDPGLFANAEELRDLIRPVLSRALDMAGGRVNRKEEFPGPRD